MLLKERAPDPAALGLRSIPTQLLFYQLGDTNGTRPCLAEDKNEQRSA